MDNIILKEDEYAEKILNSKRLDKKPTLDLKILAKYYCFKKELTPHRIYLELIEIMEEKYNNFSLAKWQSILLDISAHAKKYPLIHIDYIPITKNELLTIDGIVSKPMKRLAFTLLCLAKYKNLVASNNNDWVNYKFKDIFKMANVNATKKEQGFMIYDMKTLGLITMSKIIDNLSVNVCYIDKDNSDEILQIEDFRNLGYKYLLYCGEKFTKCKECGVLMKQNKQNNRIYCHECNKYETIDSITIKCIDCGKKEKIPSMSRQKERCLICYDIYRRNYKTQNDIKRYHKIKNNVVSDNSLKSQNSVSIDL